MRGLLLALSLLLCSCDFRHHYRTKTLPLTCTDLGKKVERALADPTFAAGELPPQAWWQLFGDANLDQLVQIALHSHPDIKTACARVQLACQEMKEKRSWLFPQIDFNPLFLRQKISRTSPFFLPQFAFYTLMDLELDFVYEIDIWQKNHSKFSAALDEMRARWAEEREAELLLAVAVAKTYFDLQGNLLRAYLAQNRLEARKHALALQTLRFERGIIAAFDVAKADLEIAEIGDFLAFLDAEIEIAKNALSSLCGNGACMDIEPLLACPHASFEGPFPLPPTLPLDLISRRPEITAQRWRIEKACYQIKAAEAEFYPSFDLMASPAFLTTHLSELFTWASFNGALELASHLPIFNAGRLCANLGVAQEELEIAINDYNASILNAIQEVSDWIAQLKNAEIRLQELSIASEDAKKVYTLNRELFERGVGTYLPVLDAEAVWLIEEDKKAVVALLKWQAVVGLMKALGGGYSECD